MTSTATSTAASARLTNTTSKATSGPTPAEGIVVERTYPTPAGALAVLARLVDGRPVVVAAGFCPSADLIDRLPETDASDVHTVDRLDLLDEPIGRYLNGDLAALDEVPVDQTGTELQQKVWTELRAIPAGQTRTYTELATAAGRPRAVRAIGSACGRNLIAPFVPCHRALRSDGTFGGYYYGLDVKRWLLDHEAGNPTGTVQSAS